MSLNALRLLFPKLLICISVVSTTRLAHSNNAALIQWTEYLRQVFKHSEMEVYLDQGLPVKMHLLANYESSIATINNTKEVACNLISSRNVVIYLEIVTDVFLKFVEKLILSECMWNTQLFLISADELSPIILNELALRIPLNMYAYVVNLHGNAATSGFSMLGIYSYKTTPFSYHITTSSEDGIESFLDKSFQPRMNLNGITVVGGALVLPGYETYTDLSSSGELQGGWMVEMYRYFKDSLNFREKAYVTNQYIKLVANGRLKGLAELLNNGQVDVAISYNSVQLVRISGPDALAFLHVFINSWPIAIFVQPSTFSVKEMITQSLGVTSWVAYLVFVIVIGICIKIIRFYESKNTSEQNSELNNITLVVVSIVCQRGLPDNERLSLKLKSVITGFLLTAMSISNFFDGSLLSILSSEGLLIQELKDLPKYSFNVYYAESEITAKGVLPANFKMTSRAFDAALLKTLGGSKSAMITSHQGAFINALGNDSHLQVFACNALSKIRIGRTPLYMAMAVKKGSPIRGVLNIKTIQMLERGVQRRLVGYHRSKLLFTCLPKSAKHYTPIEITHLATPFIIILAGIVISVGGLTFEKRKTIFCPTF